MSEAFHRETIDVLGVAFDNLTMAEAVDRSWALLNSPEPAYVVTPNPEIVMACRENPEAQAAVAGAALTIPDGVGIIYGAKLLKTPLKEKIPGIDLTTALLERLGARGGSVYLLGGRPGVAEAAGKTMLDMFPGLRLAGTHDGYFQESDSVVATVNTAGPDLLLVCLGAPKQELWMHAHLRELSSVGLMIGAGGSVDVFAGTAVRAPKGWQDAGLEWLYRLLKEPRRLGRMMRLPKFLLCVIFRKKK